MKHYNDIYLLDKTICSSVLRKLNDTVVLECACHRRCVHGVCCHQVRAHYNKVPSSIQCRFSLLLYKDVFELHKTAHRSVYQQFAGDNIRSSPHHFYERVCNYVTGYLAMTNMFHMDSNVRLKAIQNLGTNLSC